MNTLLFVDDDVRQLKANHTYFSQHNFTVFTAESGPTALNIIRAQPIDCIMMDIMMPGQTGYSLCKQMKAECAAPIIFLTCLATPESLYQGFLEGGDDYLTKPYDFRELELRIHARIEQSQRFLRRGALLEFPPLVIDVAGQQACVNGVPVPLTGNEFNILALLARAPGTVFPLSTIYHEIWHLPDLETTHTVRVHLGHLRKKMEAACPQRTYIHTVWGRGYRFSAE